VLHRPPRRSVEAQHLANPWPRRVVPSKERAAPSLRVAGETHVVTLALYADHDVADAGPGVELGAHGVKGAVVRGRGRPANPSAARRSWLRWSSTRYSINLTTWR
jgi:hypothetical protein